MHRSGRPSVRTRAGMRPRLVAWCLVFLALSACTVETESKAVSFGPSEKVCQLTGDTDWETGQPTTTLTETLSGLARTDLGSPVEHAGRLALLFGDTGSPAETGPRNERGPPDDAVGWIATRTPPTAARCTDLRVMSRSVRVIGAIRPAPVHPLVVAPAPIKQGIFNVPSGGVSNGGWLYGFFWTDHCNDPNDPKTCPQSTDLNGVGRGVVARSSDDGASFRDAVPLPRGFVYATAVDAAALPDVPAEQRLGTYVVGVPIYRGSVPYLAYAPPGALPDPAAWRFFLGRRADGQPIWTSSDVWTRGRGGAGGFAPPGQPELFAAAGPARCVGELSLTWNRVLRLWMLLYTCEGAPEQRIVARVADAPWGPWSAAADLISASSAGVSCRLLMDATRCGGRPNFWPNEPATGKISAGVFYAPAVMERFTTPEAPARGGRRAATIYWMVSTWNPYEVGVMRTHVEATNTRYRFTPPIQIAPR